MRKIILCLCSLTFTIYIVFANLTVSSFDLMTKISNIFPNIFSRSLFLCKKTSTLLVHDNAKLYIDWLVIIWCLQINTEMKENRTTETRTFNCHGKSVESFVMVRQIVFCSGYNAPTLFRNIQKMYLTCRNHGTQYGLLSVL